MLITPQVKNTGFSQLGNSGFTVNLQTPLDKDKPVCSAEIYVLNPKNTAFLLTVGNKSFEGKLDATMIPVNFAPNCAFDVSQIKLDIKSPNNLYNPIEEIKLFTQKQDPPIEPPVCPPDSYWDSKLKKCVAINPPIGNNTAIVNSTIALTVSNSTITIDADEGSEIITILGDAKDNNNNEDEQDKKNLAKDVEEEEQEQEQDKDDKKDKDQKDDKN